ncbi:MAG TPA: gliding motility-associated C-terminal domain-containing protein, partial [Flavobacteriales bacterium]|nr:gliding motility-associated C-terminal domain-containing protein [Flavobacteriales bacterium]
IDATTSHYDSGHEVSGLTAIDGSIDVNVLGGTSPYSYAWNTGSTTASITGLGAGQYVLTVTDANGCSDTLDVTLTAPDDLDLPTGFTPNGDGYNDHFIIHGVESYPASLFTVFNRWGNIVYERLNYKNDWSGENSSGEMLPNGTYFVIFNINNGERTLETYVDLRR